MHHVSQLSVDRWSHLRTLASNFRPLEIICIVQGIQSLDDRSIGFLLLVVYLFDCSLG